MTWRGCAAIVLGALSGCGSSETSPAAIGCPDCTVLTGANVFDGTHAGPGTVVLRGDRIESLHRGRVQVVAGDVVQLEGHTILPGLIDTHVHIRPSALPSSMPDRQEHVEAHFKALLRSGVTTVLDLGAEQHVVFAYRSRIRKRVLLAPSLLAAGPALTPSGGHPCYAGRPAFDLCAFIDTPQDAPRVVGGFGKDEPDVVKVIIESGTEVFPLPELSAESLVAIRSAADAIGVPVVTHVAETDDMIKALDAGVRFFAHLPVHDRIDATLAQRLVAAEAVVMPTAAVVDARYRVAAGSLTEVQGDEAFADVPQAVVEAWRDPGRYEDMATPEARQEASRRRENLLANVRVCHDAGVVIAAGTDAGNPATFHGLSLHRELSLYVEAGMSARDALRAATRDAARAFNLADRGEIAAGNRADLVIARGDPTTDIAALSNIERVYLLGEHLMPSALAVSGAQDLARSTLAALDEGEPCLGAQECASGLVCTAFAWCRTRCTSLEDCEGQTCFHLDANTEPWYCHTGDGCDPITQDCPNEVACVWLGQGATRCWYPGKGEAGEPCASWGMCAPGYQCDEVADVCVRLCDPGSLQPMCEAGQTCVDRTAEAGRPVGECR